MTPTPWCKRRRRRIASSDELPITDYPETTAQNISGSLMADRNAIIGWFGRFLPVGFYYRAFYKPFGVWHWWERFIRKAAGLGVANLSATPHYQDKQYLFCDVAVVGARTCGPQRCAQRRRRAVPRSCSSMSSPR